MAYKLILLFKIFINKDIFDHLIESFLNILAKSISNFTWTNIREPNIRIDHRGGNFRQWQWR